MFRVRFLKNNVKYCNIQYIYIKTVKLCTNLRCGPDGKIKFFSIQFFEKMKNFEKPFLLGTQDESSKSAFLVLKEKHLKKFFCSCFGFDSAKQFTHNCYFVLYF